MYTEQDYLDIRNQLKRRWLFLGVPALLMLACVILAFIFRVRWLTTVLTILLGGYCIFTYGLLLSPVIAYERHLDNVLHARVRTTTGAFKEMEKETVMREGVAYYPVIINVGNIEEPEDDRLFYYDANLLVPDWQAGDRITVTAHDKAMGAWEKA